MSDIIYSCHQPNFIPWLGYFHKILNSDYFVILDEVQYVKNTIANRNKIKTSSGEQYITVPIAKRVNDSSFFSYKVARIADENWHIKAFKTIEQNYTHSKYFSTYKNEIFEIFKMKDFCEMNICFIQFILQEFEITSKILLMSDLKGISGKKSELLVNIGNALGANIYLSGNGARSYNEADEFEKNDILIRYQKFNHPEYCQLYPPFLPYLSVLDLLFNEGSKGKSFLEKQEFGTSINIE